MDGWIDLFVVIEWWGGMDREFIVCELVLVCLIFGCDLCDVIFGDP